MLGLFKNKPIITYAKPDFQKAVFTWLLRNFGGVDFYQKTRLIFLNEKFFPSLTKGEKAATGEILEAVKKHAGMGDWPCKLMPQKTELSANAKNKHKSQTNGKQASNSIAIFYDTSLTSTPEPIVSSFAFQLAQYLNESCDENPPGDSQERKLVSSITAVFMGFGVIVANCAAHSELTAPHQPMSEAELCLTLAIFIGLLDIDLNTVLPHLASPLRKPFLKMHKELATTNMINELKEVAYRY